MKCAVLLIALSVLSTGWSAVGWESWLKPSMYGAWFDEYAVGEQLSDKGAQNGTWGFPAVPSGASAVAEIMSARKGLHIEVGTGEVAFVPDDTGDRTMKSVFLSVRMVASEVLPDVPASAKSAFAVYANDEGEDATFMGWSAQGWRALRLTSGYVSPTDGGWRLLSARFTVKDGKLRVQYRLKVDGEFVTLVDDDGKSWLDAAGTLGDGPILRKIGFRGDGGLEYMSGSEPARGLLISLVPWREILIEETVNQHDTGSWTVFDSGSGTWLDTPLIIGDAYYINVKNGEDYNYFTPKKDWSSDVRVVEFAVRFCMPDYDGAYPEDACALVKVVEEPVTTRTTGESKCRFACLVGGSWVTNTTVEAKVDVDYTVEVTADKTNGQVAYRVKRGRGAESGAYQPLCSGPATFDDPLQAFFAGQGFVYEIKSTSSAKKQD